VTPPRGCAGSGPIADGSPPCRRTARGGLLNGARASSPVVAVDGESARAVNLQQEDPTVSGRLLLVVLAGVGLAAAVAGAAEPERSALTLELGKPIAGGGDWGAGTVSGGATLDLPLSPYLSAAIVAGTARGTTLAVEHTQARLDSTYVVAGLRYLSEEQGGARIYVLGAIGALYAQSREEFTYWGTTVETYSNTGATALVAFGVLVAIPRSRCSVVGEVTYLLPRTGVPGTVGGEVPTQLSLTAGLRIALGR